MENHNDEVPRRIRKRSLRLQLESVLRSSAELDSLPLNELSVARMKFLQARMTVLTQLQGRENNQKLKRALAEVASLRAENQKLKTALTEASECGSGNKHAAEIRDLLAKYGKETEEKNDVRDI
jgi:hypothetical protein